MHKAMAARREAVLDELARKIANLSLGRVVRVAIDGRTASGKTTLSEEIAALIRRMDRPVIRTSIDGFHRPKAERYARGRYSADGYYYDARDLPAIRAMLLDPLGPEGDRLYRTASFNLDRDRPIQQATQLAPADAVLIVDGTFLQRPELRDGWDVTIFVATSESVSEGRGVGRDANHLGGEEAARQLYARRYRPAFDLYERSCSPEQRADIVLNNDDLDHPRVRVRQGGRLAKEPTVMETDSAVATRLRGVWMGVADLSRSRAFYERLGARFDSAQPVDTMLHATFAGTRLVFEAGSGNPRNCGPVLLFEVTDADALYTDLLAASFEVEGAPENEPWGRQFNVLDPDGHLIAFIGPAR